MSKTREDKILKFIELWGSLTMYEKIEVQEALLKGPINEIYYTFVLDVLYQDVDKALEALRKEITP